MACYYRAIHWIAFVILHVPGQIKMISQLLWLIDIVLAVIVSLASPEANSVPHIEAKIVYGCENTLCIRTLDEESPRSQIGIQGYSPRWSPDGTKIVFDHSVDGVQSDIYVINADGTGLRQLTDHPDIDASPVWSPDGKRIVFESWRDTDYSIPDFQHWRDANSNIYVMNFDGTDQIRLTNNTFSDQSPVWSPDGRQIAFTSYRNGNSDIYIINSDGTNERRLTTYAGSDSGVEWAPGFKLFFLRDRDLYDYQFYTVTADGLTVDEVTNDLVEWGDYRWLPDGNVVYGLHLDLMYLNVSTGVSTRISGWHPYELYGGYDIWVETLEPNGAQP